MKIRLDLSHLFDRLDPAVAEGSRLGFPYYAATASRPACRANFCLLTKTSLILPYAALST
jgi:hypothetical protein